MDIETKPSDLVSLFERALQSGGELKGFEETGFVVEVADLCCKVHGLRSVVYGELVAFDGGNRGIVFNMNEDIVSIFLLEAQISVAELEGGRRTGDVFKVPVGMALCGRVINARGEAIDGLGELKGEELRPIEAHIPGIVARSPVNESLETGIMVVDALVAIGRGQRELIIGNRNTGKTSLVLDTIAHQKGKNVFCIYVSIGQRQANLARIVQNLQIRGALDYTII